MEHTNSGDLTTQIVANLTQVIEPVVRSAGLYLEKIVVKGGANQRHVEVYVDLPTGTDSLNSGDLETVSRDISRALDVADPIGGRYVLEVSTLGAEHELSNPRLFSRAIGKDIQVRREGKTYEGKLVDSDDTSFRVNLDGRDETFTFESIELAKTVVTFGKSRRK